MRQTSQASTFNDNFYKHALEWELQLFVERRRPDLVVSLSFMRYLGQPQIFIFQTYLDLFK